MDILATAYLQSLFQFFRLTEMHDPQNAIFNHAVGDVQRLVDSLMNQTNKMGIEIRARSEKLYLNRLGLRPKPRQMYVHKYFIRFMRSRKLAGFKILLKPKEDHLKIFLWSLANLEPGENAVLELTKIMRSQGIDEFEVEEAGVVDRSSAENNELADIELVVIGLYKQILQFAEICFDNLERAREFPFHPIQHSLNELALLADEDLGQMLRLLSLKHYERPLPYRGTNACFMTLAWGRALRLPDGVLTELGGAALAHPLALIASSNSSQPSNHIRLLEIFEALKDVWPLSDLQRLAILEYTRPYGQSGVYEVGGVRCYLHFFSRIVRITSTFEELTTYQSGKKAYLPDEAMAEMLSRKGEFDPTLLKLFLNFVGIYPIGSLVQLQSGEIAQVFAGASDPLKFQRPIVCVLKNSRGELLQRPETYDLSEINPKLGVYLRSIKRSMSFDEAKIPEKNLRVKPVNF